MNRGARETGPALEFRYRFRLWLAPMVERFPRSQKFLLGDAGRRWMSSKTWRHIRAGQATVCRKPISE